MPDTLKLFLTAETPRQVGPGAQGGIGKHRRIGSCASFCSFRTGLHAWFHQWVSNCFTNGYLYGYRFIVADLQFQVSRFTFNQFNWQWLNGQGQLQVHDWHLSTESTRLLGESFETVRRLKRRLPNDSSYVHVTVDMYGVCVVVYSRLSAYTAVFLLRPLCRCHICNYI